MDLSSAVPTEAPPQRLHKVFVDLLYLLSVHILGTLYLFLRSTTRYQAIIGEAREVISIYPQDNRTQRSVSVCPVFVCWRRLAVTF